jgi:Zn-dependent M28 family amino/carboxypeptidase
MGKATLLLASAVVLLAAIAFGYKEMPVKNRDGKLAPLSETESAARKHLLADVTMLAGTIGGRDGRKYSALGRAADYISGELQSASYIPDRQNFSADGKQFQNIEAELRGSGDPDRLIVVGAHYDTAGGLPGANDNGSGVAACLQLARTFSRSRLKSTIRWVFFTNEEPPYFQSAAMGSMVYAKRCHERKERVAAMLSLETIGYYSEERGSQSYPIGFHPGYPDRGNFLGFVADVKSAFLLRSALKSFRSATSLPAVGAAAPASIPGVGWSDHWSFWQFGYKALMLTDTAPYRYPFYHSAEDTPDKLDYDRLARAVTGIEAIVRNLASE